MLFRSPFTLCHATLYVTPMHVVNVVWAGEHRGLELVSFAGVTPLSPDTVHRLYTICNAFQDSSAFCSGTGPCCVIKSIDLLELLTSHDFLRFFWLFSRLNAGTDTIAGSEITLQSLSFPRASTLSVASLLVRPNRSE